MLGLVLRCHWKVPLSLPMDRACCASMALRDVSCIFAATASANGFFFLGEMAKNRTDPSSLV